MSRGKLRVAAALPAAQAPGKMTDDANTKCRVLVVEDEPVIAMLMEDMLDEFACDVVATAGELDAATEVARTGRIDLAFLDVNLRGVPVYPVADVLRTRGIPFAFVTGYGSAGAESAYADAPVLQKPFQTSDLAAILQRLRSRTDPATQ